LTTEAGRATRSQILAAAERLIQDRGLAAATTRAIAERAGCAEGSIYRHFPDKHAMFIEIVKSRFPAFVEIIGTLPEHAGRGSVRRTLEQVAVAGLTFYRGVIPMIGGAMAERKLLEGHRRHWEETKTGPKRVVGAISTYVRREQRLGRLSDRISAEHATRLLLGACFSQAFLEELLGGDVALGSDEQFARDLVRTLMEGMNPRKTEKGVARW
jgi:AcrR family transcriptional regulator